MLGYPVAWAQAPCTTPTFNRIPPLFRDLQIAPSTNPQTEPHVVVDPHYSPQGFGAVYVVWEERKPNNNRDIWFSSSLNGGTTWSTAIQINTLGGDNFQPSLAVDQNCTANGTVWVVWSRVVSGVPSVWQVYASLSRNRGATWLAPEVPADPAPPIPVHQVTPRVAAFGTSAWVTWTDDRFQPSGTSNRDVFLTCTAVPPVGPPVFTPVVLLNSNPGTRFLQFPDPDVPVPMNTPLGPNTHVVWQEWANSPLNVLFSSSRTYCTSPPPPEVTVPVNGIVGGRGVPGIESFGSAVGVVYADFTRNLLNWSISYQFSGNLGATWGIDIQVDPTGVTGINQYSADITMTYPTIGSPWPCGSFPTVTPRLYSSWDDDRNNPGTLNMDLDVSCTNSGGMTWSAPARVNDTIGVVGPVWRSSIAGDLFQNHVYAVWEDNQAVPQIWVDRGQ